MFSNNPATLPPWPHWIAKADSIVVSGRHLTLGRAKMVDLLAIATTIAIVILPWVRLTGWAWGNPERYVIFTLAIYLSYWQPQWGSSTEICGWLMGAVVLLGPLWYWLSRIAYGIAISIQTTVLFTADRIELPPRYLFRRRYFRDETDNIEFLLLRHPAIEEGKPLPEFFRARVRASRFVYMKYGLNLPLLRSFANPKKAELFHAVCSAALKQSAGLHLHAFPVLPITPDQSGKQE